MKRFKNWLIRKLGGYTEQIGFYQKPPIVVNASEMIPIRINYTMSIRDLIRIPKSDLDEHIKQELVNTLFNNFNLPIEMKENFEQDVKTFSTTVYVLKKDVGL